MAEFRGRGAAFGAAVAAAGLALALTACGGEPGSETRVIDVNSGLYVVEVTADG